jgi:hypothetical protein
MPELDELERALTDGLNSVAATARPPSDAWERLARRLEGHTTSGSLPDTNRDHREDMMLTPRRNEPRTRRWTLFVGAAAAAAVLILALVAVLPLRDDGNVPADQPSPPVTGAPEGPDPAAAVSVAERFMTALAEADATTAVGLVDADATINHYGQSGTRDEIEIAVSLEEATGGRIAPESCELTAPDQVTCEATYINDRVEAVGGVPADMTYFIKVENALITAYRVALDTDTFGTNPWTDYQTFVRATERNPGDFGAMFASHPDGMGIVGPLLTDTSVELHRQYTDDFVLDQADGT